MRLLLACWTIAVLAPGLGGTPGLHAAEPPDGEWRVTVPAAVPFEPSTPNRGRRAQDLDLRLVCRGGQLGPTGLASLPAMPGLWHPVRVTAFRVENGRLHAELEVELLHQPPRSSGGSAKVVLDLERSEDRLRGDYRVEITGLDDKQRAALWRTLGGKADTGFQARVQTGRTESVTHLARQGVQWGVGDQDPIVAEGRIAPVPPMPASQPAAGGRLVPGGAGLERLKLRAATQPGQDLLKRLRELCGAEGASPAERAAGWAVLAAVTGDKADIASASEAARQVVTSGRGADLASDLAGVAVAYDLCAKDWPADVRDAVRAWLVEQATWACALQPPAKLAESVFADDAALGRLISITDDRLARLRAAAGLAALAVQVEAPEKAAPVLVVARADVQRFLAAGIGSRGAGTGQTGFGATVAVLAPFIQSWQAATGEDLAAGTGAPWLAAWGLVSSGPGAMGLWSDSAGLPAAAGLAPAAHQPAIAWFVQQGGWTAQRPWAAVLGLVNLPADSSPASPAGVLPLTLEDRRMGAFVTRSGWTAGKDFVFTFQTGAGAPAAAGLRGQFTLDGPGRPWVVPFNTVLPAFTWPAPRECNVLYVDRPEAGGRGAAEPLDAGRVSRVWADRRTGSLSVSMVTHGFAEPDGAEISESKSWRTIGVDYSGASGTPCLLAVVEGTVGLADRLQVWQLNLGDLPREAVTVDGLRFTVRPPGASASLAGTVLYPTSAFVRYEPPAEGRGGRLRVYREKPGAKTLEALMKSVDDRLGAQIDSILKDETADLVVKDFDLKLEEEGVAETQRLLRQSEIVYLKLLAATSSVKMGAPDRRPQAQGNVVVVLTVQDGPAPAVQMLDTSDEALARVGGQRIKYREHQIEFLPAAAR